MPDYRQLYIDLLLKFRGFSFLGEYASATASSLEQIYLDPSAFSLLQSTMISEYLSLGSGLNFSLGYIFKNNYAIDLGYSSISPEYEDNLNSVIFSNEDLRIGISKYILENNLKISLSFNQYTDSNDQSSSLISAIMQLRL